MSVQNTAMEEEQVILVDENDLEIGAEKKGIVHLQGKLHRAFSIFIFNSCGNWLLQQRALTKYHSAGLWSNTCCSHPRPGESLQIATSRRLKEEMGLQCKLKEIFSITYQVNFIDGLSEYEFDHIFIGKSDDQPIPNPQEVNQWKWIHTDELKQDILINSGNYTYWFKISFGRVLRWFEHNRLCDKEI